MGWRGGGGGGGRLVLKPRTWFTMQLRHKCNEIKDNHWSSSIKLGRRQQQYVTFPAVQAETSPMSISSQSFANEPCLVLHVQVCGATGPCAACIREPWPDLPPRSICHVWRDVSLINRTFAVYGRAQSFKLWQGGSGLAGSLDPAWLLLLLLEAQRGHTGSRDKPLYCCWHFRVKFQCGLGTSRLYLL